MFTTRMARRIAAAALAAALAVGGLAGVGLDSADQPTDAPTEEAGVSVKVKVGNHEFGGSIQSATWS